MLPADGGHYITCKLTSLLTGLSFPAGFPPHYQQGSPSLPTGFPFITNRALTTKQGSLSLQQGSHSLPAGLSHYHGAPTHHQQGSLSLPAGLPVPTGHSTLFTATADLVDVPQLQATRQQSIEVPVDGGARCLLLKTPTYLLVNGSMCEIKPHHVMLCAAVQ